MEEEEEEEEEEGGGNKPWHSCNPTFLIKICVKQFCPTHWSLPVTPCWLREHCSMWQYSEWHIKIGVLWIGLYLNAQKFWKFKTHMWRKWVVKGKFTSNWCYSLLHSVNHHTFMLCYYCVQWLQDFVLQEAVLNLYCCCYCWLRSDHDHLYVHDSYVLIAEAYSHACLLSLQMVSQSQGFLQVIAETKV